MARSTRPRALAALLLTLGVLWAVVLVGAGVAGAQADAPAEPSTTVTVSVPTGSADELARTGPRDDAAGLGLFGFAMVGVGVVTILASRRLLTSEGHRR